MFPKVQISPIDLKFNKESNEHGQKGLRRPEDIVSGPFPVLETTYAKNKSIFEFSEQNKVNGICLF